MGAGHDAEQILGTMFQVRFLTCQTLHMSVEKPYTFRNWTMISYRY